MYDVAQSRTWKFAANTEDTVFEVQVQSLFKDQTESWITIVNGIDKFVREAMPIQEDAAKARPVLKPSSTSVGTPLLWNKKQWIYIATQKSKDPYCFQVSKFSTRLLRHSKLIDKKMVEFHYDQVIDECKKKGIRRYRILVRRNEEAIRQLLRIGQLTNGYRFWQKVETEEKVSILRWT